MPTEVLLYGEIYSFRATDFINAVQRAGEDGLTVRINSGGGELDYGFGMVAKFAEFEGSKTVKVDGLAGSMAAFFTVYADNVEALDVSRFVFHRAAYPQWIENNTELFDESRRKSLEDANAKLRSALEAKVDASQWERITGVSIDEMFSMEGRIDVELDAEQAKELGIVNKINRITPTKRAEIDAKMLSVAEKFSGMKLAAKVEEKEDKPKTIVKMNIEKFKTEHPDIYAKVLKQGEEQERDRVSAWMAYVDIDAKAVTEGIEGGKGISQKAMAELSRKAFSKEALTATEKNNAPEVSTDEPTSKEKPKGTDELEAFRASYKSELGINKEDK
jgi:ATP-dependent protease ClpP protease subunit